MRVRVRILRPLADLAGTGEASFELDGARSLRALLAEIAKAYPLLGEEILPDGESVGAAFAAIQNDVLLSAEEYDRELSDGDVVTLFAPITGGACGGSGSQATRP